MNIFYLDEDPKICAKYHCDKHVVKMILETTQLLCTAHWETGSCAHYKSSFKNHPCAKWARKSLSNYNWLCNLGLELCKEYTYRYGKRHKCQNILEWLVENKIDVEMGIFEDLPLCMPEYCKIGDSLVSYREYYKQEKRYFATWKKREIPKWFKGE